MTDEEALIELEPHMRAIPADQVKEPNIPVEFIVGEGLFLASMAEKHKGRLLARNLDWTHVEGMRDKSRALRKADTAMLRASFGSPDLAERWSSASSEAAGLREQLIHDLYYALDGDEKRTAAVREISLGSSYMDLVQDMSDLHGVGLECRAQLEAVGVDMASVERAGVLATELGDLLAQTSVEKIERSPEKQLRDRAFTLLAVSVEKVRKCGRTVFWREPKLAGHFASAYLRRQRRKSEKAKAAPAPKTPAPVAG